MCNQVDQLSDSCKVQETNLNITLINFFLSRLGTKPWALHLLSNSSTIELRSYSLSTNSIHTASRFISSTQTLVLNSRHASSMLNPSIQVESTGNSNRGQHNSTPSLRLRYALFIYLSIYLFIYFCRSHTKIPFILKKKNRRNIFDQHI